jgi:hypothetical protein
MSSPTTLFAMVSWISLVVSALALLISLYVAVQNRPRLGVFTRNGVTVEVGKEAIYTWYITVINSGQQPQAVSDVGLVGKERSFSAAISTLRDRGVGVVGPDLPAVVPPYSFLNWTVPDDAMRQHFPQSRQEFRSYMVRYSPVFRSVRINRIAEVFRSKRRRVIGTVIEYQHGYLRMPERSLTRWIRGLAR